MCWIGQEYRFASDIKWQRGQQAWCKSLQRLNAPPRSVPSLFDGIAQNKAQTSSPKGGREGKFYKNNILSDNLAGHQNPIK